MKGRWIDQPLICLGSLVASCREMPPSLQHIDPSHIPLDAPPQNAYRLTWRSGTRREFFYRMEACSTLLKGYDRVPDAPTASKSMFDQQRKQTRLETYLEETRSPTWKKRLVERAVLLASGTLRMYPSDVRYVIRNTRRKEYFRFDSAGVVKGELESVFFQPGNYIPLDMAVCIVFVFLISWSSSNTGLEDEMVRGAVTEVRGRWAGDTFDVCKAQEVEGDEEWRDIAEETLLLLRLYLPRMYRNMHGLNRWGETTHRSLLMTSMSPLY
ncbi:hypothetical protein ABW20_dc0107183 [Dactylellina cionopaga]|nr:hypothetical protein ABW20_dc0107183 [Dactylellina cionopaga]